MKFRFILWAMGLLMARASRNNPAFQQQLRDKDLVFQMQTLDGKVARHFIVSNERISSKAGKHAQPAFAIAFKDAAYGFATLQASNKQLAFMQGIQDKNIQIKGNPALVIWFQGLMKYLKPRKRKA
nr:helicase [uncultured Pseudomonas sp.]